MAEYALTAESLLSFGRNPPSGDRAFVRWAAFADKVGQAVFPFIIRPDRLEDVPFQALGMTPVKLSDMVPQPGEMWVLFCFKDSFRDAVSPDSPLRTDGFPLVLEWRRGQTDSELLSSAFHDLADRVREQFGEEGKGWGLHPAFDRYGDTIAFTDSNLFSDAENSLQIASAWGALAAGLHCCIKKKFPGVWPFPSVQWDWDRKKASGVAGIADKLSVAVDCGAETVTVAAEQMKDAGRILRDLKKGKDAGKFKNLCLYAVRDGTNVGAIIDDIAWGAYRRNRRKKIAFRINLFVLVVFIGLFIWQKIETAIEQHRNEVTARTLVQNIKQTLAAHDQFGDGSIEALRSLRSVLFLPEAKSLLRSALASRNWLVPVANRRASSSPIGFMDSILECESKEFGIKRKTTIRQIWTPHKFPVKYDIRGSMLSATDSMTGKTHFWTADFTKEDVGSSDPIDNISASFIATWRVSPCGLVGIAEVSTSKTSDFETATQELVAKDPFSGKDLWRHTIPSAVVAFAFSNNGERFAYALRNGIVVVEEMRTGLMVAQYVHFCKNVAALVFEKDDSYLHVSTEGADLTLSIVCQWNSETCMTNEGNKITSEVNDTADAERLLSLLVGRDVPQGSNIAFCMAMSGIWGEFARYASLRPAGRSINLHSTTAVTNAIESFIISNSISEYKAALGIQPDSSRVMLGAWTSDVRDIARGNAAMRIKCDYQDERLTGVRYEEDPQSVWYGDFILRHVLSLDPRNNMAKDLLAQHLKRTNRDKLPDLEVNSIEQCEPNWDKRRVWFKWCRCEFEKKRICKIKDELAFKRKQNDIFYAPQVDDDARGLWGKMLRLINAGTEEGVIRCLDAYAKVPVSIDDEGEREKFVPAVRQFIKERKKRNIKGGFVVMRYKPPATSHATFDIGDIVIAVNGIRDVSNDDFIRMERECNENCELEILRYNPSTKTFDELKVPLAKGECPVMTRNLAESK